MKTHLAMLCVLLVAAGAPSEADAAGARSRHGGAAKKTAKGAKGASSAKGAKGASSAKGSTGERSGKPTRTSRDKGNSTKANRGAKSRDKRGAGGRSVTRVASDERRDEREQDPDDREPAVPADGPRRGRAGVLTPIARIIHCPADMVAVAGRVCVDRFELHLVDAASGDDWSPFFPPSLERAKGIVAFYEGLRTRESEPWLGAFMALPALPAHGGLLRAISEAGIVPQGHMSADDAENACRASSKRLCSESEWLTACRGEASTDFPYGDQYEQGACNVYRESHPSWLLHGNAARYHDDPRNNAVATDQGTLLRKTGATAACGSRWGDDAIYDMVGNLDEWVADRQGLFAGGFYSRPTKSGCFSRVSNHPRAYSDYSTGARCCADPAIDG